MAMELKRRVASGGKCDVPCSWPGRGVESLYSLPIVEVGGEELSVHCSLVRKQGMRIRLFCVLCFSMATIPSLPQATILKCFSLWSSFTDQAQISETKIYSIC
jgi:hypothetical protein